MSVVIITGAAGLIGSRAAEHFAGLGLDVVGVDNDMRQTFFGPEGSTSWMRQNLELTLGSQYTHVDLDIRDRDGLDGLFQKYGENVSLVIHTAAQPSHDWAARDPFTDFDVNAVGTLNVLETVRRHCAEAPFIFTSTNKVYGDAPNSLPLIEQERRWEIDPAHTYVGGIREDMSIDQCLHSVFGASKVAADVMVQEYGRYFGLRTACFRGGTLTGPNHSAAELHGFLAYVMRCTMTGTHYNVYGYKGKQVRDAIHSSDLISCFEHFWRAPRVAEVYNIGGGRDNSCSILEAFAIAEKFTGRTQISHYVDENRIGDHICYISDLRKMRTHYPAWNITISLEETINQIVEAWRSRDV